MRTGGPRRRLPWCLPAATLVLEALGLTAGLAAAEPTAIWLAATFATPIVAFALVGGLVSSRLPDNPIGWLLSTIGLMFGLVVACSAGARWGLRGEHLTQRVWEWVALGSNGWVVAIGLIGTQLALRLPNGALPSRRWRWFSGVSAALVAISVVGMATQRGRVEGVPGTSNPIGWAITEPLAAVFLLVILSFPVSVATLLLRYRRANGRDRAKLRWVAFGGVVFVGVYVGVLATLAFVEDDGVLGNLATSMAQVAFAAFPIGIGFAVLRQDLYDIDVVINRALVYFTLTTILAGSYLGGVLLLQLLLDRFTQGSGLAVAASTLATAALVRPARGRIQDVVDRRFFRRKYDAARTLEQFILRLRDQVDLDAISADLEAVAVTTMQPAYVTLWLRPSGAPR